MEAGSDTRAGGAVGSRSHRRSGPVGWLLEPTLAGMARRKALLGYLFLFPTIAGILLFTAGPVFASLGLSLFKWDALSPAEFVGLGNFRRLINDERVPQTFSNTIRFTLLAVSMEMVLALFLALAVEAKMGKWLRRYFRSAYFTPLLTSGASISIVLAYMFHTDFGPINFYLGQLGIAPVPWLSSRRWALFSVALSYVWRHLGFTFIVFTGGVRSIPFEVLDAADVDGAHGWRRIWQIILPMLSPTILFAAVVNVIGALQVFAQPFVLTRGGPGDATRSVVMIIFEAAMKGLEIGYGSAIALFLFAAILIVTAFQFWISKRWVFYQ